MMIKPLRKDHENMDFKYLIKVQDDPQLLEAVEYTLDEENNEIYGENDNDHIKNVYFNRHLYQPLLAELADIKRKPLKFSPAGLNDGEQRFIDDLRKYWGINKGKYGGCQIFVLRNLPRKGVGFYETHFFYPDFIIWLKQEDKQHLIFADPKGLGFAWGKGFTTEKFDLSENIKDIENELAIRYPEENITLDSFIISVTPSHSVEQMLNMRKPRLEEKHILFQEGGNGYIGKMLDVAFPGLT